MNSKLFTVHAFLSSIRSWPVLTIVAWAVIFIPRIWSLGFYYGDSWATIVAVAHGHYHTYGSLFDLIVLFSPKPVATITHLLLVLIARDNTHLWHGGMALACLMGAICLYLFIKRLDLRRDGKYAFTSDLAAALWLSAPLSLGATALPNMLNALIGQVLFFLCGIKLIELARDRDLSVKKLAFALALLLGSYWSYEVYYFQYVALLGMIYLYSNPRASFKRCVILGCSTTALQFFCIAYNRLIGYLGRGGVVGSKTYNTEWRDTINADAIAATFSYNLANALGIYFQPIFISVCVMTGAAAVTLIVKIVRREWEIAWVPFAGVVLLVVCYLFAALVCALAGYGMAYLGVESRIAMVPVFLFALCAFVLLTATRNWVPASIIAHGAGLVLLFNLGMLDSKLTDHWRESWALQRSVLREARSHQNAMRNLTPESVVVFIGPYYVGSAPVFQADIALSVAVKEQFKPFQPYPGVKPYFLSVYNGHTISWRDGVLIQTASSGGEQRKEASDVWVWNYFEKKFRRMKDGETFDPEKLGCVIPKTW